MKARTIDPSVVHVAKNLAGVPLASPTRRFLAYAVDWVIIVLVSSVFFLLQLAVSLHRTDPGALEGLKTLAFVSDDSLAVRRQALVKTLPLLVRKEAVTLPRQVLEAVERGEIEAAAAELDGNSVLIAYNFGHPQHAAKPGPKDDIRIQLENLIPTGLKPLSIFAAGALFFALPWTFGRGATLGNWIFGIRVVRLDGHRLNLLESFERFLGYLHIPATGGLALLGLWRDPLRRMPHDRVANTVVIRTAGRGKNAVRQPAASGAAAKTRGKAARP